MANPVYLTLNGELQGLISSGCSSMLSIGNKAQIAHQDQIMVTSLSHGLSRAQNVNHQELTITKPVDKSSPLLGKAISENECLTCDFVFYRTNRFGINEPYYKLKLANARLSNIGLTIPHTINDQEWNATQIIEYLESGIHYAKKEPGGLRRFDIKLLEQLNRRKRILDIMETSIRQRRFKVWYQPVFNLKTNRFSSAEAPLRLRDYDGEPVSPSEFIPLAEETGLIDDLSWIVLEEVCTLLGQMRDKIDSISINLSMQQFEDRSLCARIHECLNRSGLNPDQLKIEVTERVLLQDMDYMKMMMEEMTGEGFGFYLDDFGTGYSNISCALSLPFEYIKLDRSLLVRLPGDSKVQVFVRSMVETFHAMGQKIVAEGVEEEEQIELLRQFGVDCVQGYYYGKPMPEDEFRAAVAKGWEEQRR